MEHPHRALARANAKHAMLTDELRTLKADWAKRNIQAQQTRLAISTPEITHIEKRRRELHLALEATQAEIGRLGRLIKQTKATRQAGKPLKGNVAQPKKMPWGEHPEYPTYFLLAARNELAPGLFCPGRARSSLDDLRREKDGPGLSLSNKNPNEYPRTENL